jgi:hypothetical protein
MEQNVGLDTVRAARQFSSALQLDYIRKNGVVTAMI